MRNIKNMNELVAVVPRMSLDGILDRFNQRVKKTERCWLWTGATNNLGYGQCWLNSTRHSAHRVALWAAGRETPIGMHVDHLCRNPSCVNPDHLEVVTPSVNTMRGLSPLQLSMRAKNQTACKHGHPFAGDNLIVSSRGSKVCRTCNLQWQRDYKQRVRERK